MVFFVVTRQGYDELRRSCGHPSHLWLASDVLSEPEIEAARAAGADVTVFNRAFDATDVDAIEGAVHTIAQHHPGQPIWVERKDDVVEASRMTSNNALELCGYQGGPGLAAHGQCGRPLNEIVRHQ